MKVDKALILSAGFGTRMGEIGKTLPKILWPIFDKSLLELQALYLKEMGVKDIFINLFHQKDKIIDYCKKNETFNDVKKIIIGHLHPIYNQQDSPLSGYQIWSILKTKTNELFEKNNEDIEIITVPSFNKELTASGFSIHRKKNICPIIRKTRPYINEAVFLTLEGDIIGDINSLSEII